MSRRTPDAASLGRERRRQTSVSIRKKGRDTRVAAERTAGNDPPALPLSDDEINALKRFGIPQLVDDFRSGTETIMRATMATRKLLTAEKDSEGLVDKLIALGLVKDLCATLDRVDSPRLQFEGLFALSNCSMLRPEIVVKEGALPKMVHLLGSRGVSLREQALWSVGNIMSKSPAYRNQCLSLGVVDRIRHALEFIYPMTNADLEVYAKANEERDSLAGTITGASAIPLSRTNFLRQATWALSNTVRGGDIDDDTLRGVAMCLGIIREVLLTVDDPNILANSMWTLADVADRRPRAILELGISDRIIELALHPHEAVQGAASQCISNMCAGDGQAMRALMVARRADLIFCSHLRSERMGLWLNASWTLSMVCSELVVVSERLLPQSNTFLEKLCDKSARSEVRQDCAAIISSLFCSSEKGSEAILYHEMLARALVEPLDEGAIYDVDLTSKVIMCTLNILQKGGPGFRQRWEESGGLTRLQMVESSYNVSRTNGVSPLAHALESFHLYLDDWENEDELYAESSPSRPFLMRHQAKGENTGAQRLDFQAFMKD